MAGKASATVHSKYCVSFAERCTVQHNMLQAISKLLPRLRLNCECILPALARESWILGLAKKVGMRPVILHKVTAEFKVWSNSFASVFSYLGSVLGAQIAWTLRKRNYAPCISWQCPYPSVAVRSANCSTPFYKYRKQELCNLAGVCDE